jgi:hypothetical protein
MTRSTTSSTRSSISSRRGRRRSAHGYVASLQRAVAIGTGRTQGALVIERADHRCPLCGGKTDVDIGVGMGPVEIRICRGCQDTLQGGTKLLAGFFNR